jgi:hypothetical protein
MGTELISKGLEKSPKKQPIVKKTLNVKSKSIKKRLNKKEVH